MNNKHYQKAFRFVCQCRHGFERRSEGNHVKRFFDRLRLIGNHFSYSEGGRNGIFCEIIRPITKILCAAERGNLYDNMAHF